MIPDALIMMFFREANARSFGSAEVWTKESAREELTQQMNRGVLGIVWRLGTPSVPVGFAVCEQNQSSLVLSHFYLDPMPREQESLITKELFHKVVRAQMRRLGLQTVSVTAPLFSAQPIQLCLKGVSVSSVGVY
jgi:hypothetical protein